LAAWARKIPVYGAILMTATFASLGLPGLAGFISEFMVFRGAFATLTIIASISVLALSLARRCYCGK
jgi:NADH-quinone oxidoreductase subunit M